MCLISELSWKVEAKQPAGWGRKTTKEEKEEIKKEKHTPGKKKKKGRSQIKLDRAPGRYAGRDRPEPLEEKGQRCGDSYIAKEDECHVDDVDALDKGASQEIKDAKKPRVRKGEPHGKKPKKDNDDAHKKQPSQLGAAPSAIFSPAGGAGKLLGPGYLSTGEDGMYDMQRSVATHRVYFPKVIDQAAAQYVSSNMAELMGLAVQKDYHFYDANSKQHAAGHINLPFVELDEVQLSKLARTSLDISGWFVHSVLVRHDGVVGSSFENMVMLNEGRPTVLHFGGTLLWAANGTKHPDGMAEDDLAEVHTLRAPEINWQTSVVFGKLTTEQLSVAVSRHLKPVKESDILALVDAAKFNSEDRAVIGKGLVMRKRHLENTQW